MKTTRAAKQYRKTLTAAALLAPMLAALTAVVVLAGSPGVAGDTTADAELGQLDFLHSTAGFVRPQALNLGGDNVSANGVAYDEANGHLYVVDARNRRVLGWPSAASFHNGDPAAIVIGESDFYSISGCSTGGLCNPTGIAVDRSGNVYVADDAYSEIIEFESPFSQKPPITGSVVATGPFDVWGITVDGRGNLYAADRDGSRVLEYNAPLNHPKTPSRVFGQINLTATACNKGKTSPDAATLCDPRAVALDSVGNLYVADTLNNRILRYNTPLNPSSGEPGAGDTTADMVFGQSHFNTAGSGTSAVTLNQPRGVTADLDGNLWVTDTENHRATEYDPPLNSGEAATLVIGQENATTAGRCNRGHIAQPDSLCAPTGATTDNSGNLYVHDSGNNRIVEYNEGHTPMNTVGDRELGQIDLVHNTVDFVDLTTVNAIAIAIDRHSTPQHLYAVDAVNNRVLGYKDANTFKNGGPASLVLGQFDFWNNFNVCTFVSPNTLCLSPAAGGIAVDSQGNVWVADTGYRRVVGFKAPFATGLTANQGAAFVLGAPNLETTIGGIGCGASATNTCGAAGLAVDSSDNLYVVDADNQRVLEFNQPRSYAGTLPEPASLVFGQGSTGKNFAGGGCNQGGISANSLCHPIGVAVDTHNDLYVADSANNRVLEYERPLPFGKGTPGKPGAAGDVTADLVFGQGSGGKSLASDACNASGLSALTLCTPEGVSTDPFNTVFISDAANNRVLAYKETANPPANVIADLEFGQGSAGTDFTAGGANAGGLSANSLDLAVADQDGIANDANGDLFVADTGNNRLLMYAGGFLGAPIPAPTLNAR